MSQMSSFLDMPFEAQIELPNELWMEPWLDTIEDFPFEGTHVPHGGESFELEHEGSPSVPFNVGSDAGSSSSTPGSIGYMSTNCSPGSFAFSENLEAAQAGASNLSAYDVVQTAPVGDPSPQVSQKKRTDDHVAKPKKQAKSPKAPTQMDDRNVDPNKYKTRLCRNWKETGKCPYGETCVYAHGTKEVRCKEDNEAVVLSLTKLADHLSRQKVLTRLAPPRLPEVRTQQISTVQPLRSPIPAMPQRFPDDGAYTVPAMPAMCNHVAASPNYAPVFGGLPGQSAFMFLPRKA